jgi:hypothetical protein
MVFKQMEHLMKIANDFSSNEHLVKMANDI